MSIMYNSLLNSDTPAAASLHVLRACQHGVSLHNMARSSFIFLVASLCLYASVAYAGGGTGVYDLEWKNPSEVLEYHSCGCADACWIAEVKDRKTKKLKARLRCDCERLYYRPGRDASERLHAKSCAVFDVPNKPEMIQKTMSKLLKQ
jgi:hypothetical protein